MQNKVMLITYADSMGQNLRELRSVLDAHFAGAVAGVHLLPIFPSSGDRGFAPLCYDRVDPAFGTWQDVQALAQGHELMLDYMINHISAQSEYYQDFLQKGDASAYRNLFIRYKDFWPGGEPTQRQVDVIYKRKPRAPYVDACFADGSSEKVWCTFGEEQIDLNLTTSEGLAFLEDNLRGLARNGAAMVRLDAFAYATKKADTNCFFVEPQVWQLLQHAAYTLAEENAEILPEIHEHYTIQQKIAAEGHYVYDFALPMLVLHALYFGQGQHLKHWLDICPRKQFTTLDTHDGIGVVDVRDLLPEAEIEKTKQHLYRYGANVKEVYSTAAYNNLDIYQLNCTYYSALNHNDDAYLLARLIQFFAPGTPQVYYVGLLAGENDLELLERTKEGRNINRHYYSVEEIGREVQRPVVQKLVALMRLRNSCAAFNGSFAQKPCAAHQLHLCWALEGESIELKADLAALSYELVHTQNGVRRQLEL